MTQRQRILWIDSVKGIAILLLLFSHSMTKFDLFKTWIFAFHMPIFFIICGYLVFYKYPNGFKPGHFKDLLSKRWYNLFIPYFVFGFVLIIFLNLLRFISGDTIIATSQFINLLSMKGIESLWFLPIYFFSEFILIFFLGAAKGLLRFLAIILLTFLLSLIDQTILNWPFDLFFKIAEGSIFVFVGFYLAATKIEERTPIIIAIIIFFLSSLSTTLNQGASMVNMKSTPLYLANAIFLSISLIKIIHFITEKKGTNIFISFFGMNSLIVVCTNNMIIEIVRLLDFKLFNNCLLHLGYPGIVIFFIIITICEYPLLKLFSGKFKKEYISTLLKGI